MSMLILLTALLVFLAGCATVISSQSLRLVDMIMNTRPIPMLRRVAEETGAGKALFELGHNG